LLVLISTSLFTSAKGREPTVKVRGVVVDWQYARVLPTTILFESAGQTKQVKVDDQGAYEIDLPPGRYLVKASAPNFIERRVKLQLESTAPRTLNLMLDVQPQNFRCPKGALCL
jgi:Carboxypeptidase regulatory-like domain